eukprot:152630-Chlamydomonas_euryale.AAC.1
MGVLQYGLDAALDGFGLGVDYVFSMDTAPPGSLAASSYESSGDAWLSSHPLVCWAAMCADLSAFVAAVIIAADSIAAGIVAAFEQVSPNKTCGVTVCHPCQHRSPAPLTHCT